MLSKKYRLKNKEIAQIARRGKRVSSDLFDIKLWFDSTKITSRFSFVVSKKIDKRATVRNSIKRKFRAAVFELEKNKKLKKADYIFIIKGADLSSMSSNEIKILIIKALNLPY